MSSALVQALKRVLRRRTWLFDRPSPSKKANLLPSLFEYSLGLKQVVPHLARPSQVASVGGAPLGWLPYLHYFRGLAIMQIMVLHAGTVFMLRGSQESVPASNVIFSTNYILFHGATLYFTIVSGIIYSRRYSDLKNLDFYYERSRDIAVPYIFMTVLFTAIMGRLLILNNSLLDGSAAYLKALADNLLLGKAQNSYWYIPIILMLFFISPILRNILSSRVRSIFIVATIFMPLLVSRTGTDVSFSTFIYFLGAYVLGMLIGEDIEDRLRWMERQVRLFALLAASATLILWYLNVNDVEYWGPISLRESVYYVQKISLGMLLLVWLWRRSDNLPQIQARILDMFASFAFGLYFLHVFVFRRFVGIAAELSAFPGSSWYLISGSAVIFVVGTIACFVILFLLRTILGERSRSLVGA